MGYVIAAVVVLLIVAAGITFMVLSATRKQRQASAADSDYGRGAPGSEAAIVAPDDKTPLGDTDQHAGEQTREGTTVSGHERGRGSTPAGGEGGSTPARGEGGVGGEGEGGRHVGPESDRLANRSR
jgi:hypothetical protein